MVFSARFFTWWKETAYCGRRTPLEQRGQVFEEAFLEIYHWALSTMKNIQLTKVATVAQTTIIASCLFSPQDTLDPALHT